MIANAPGSTRCKTQGPGGLFVASIDMKALLLPLTLLSLLVGAILFAQARWGTTSSRPTRVCALIRWCGQMEGWSVHVDPALLEGETRGDGEQGVAHVGGPSQSHFPADAGGPPWRNFEPVKSGSKHKHPSLGAMQYHPSEGWLRRHGHDPRLTRKVHIPHAEALISRAQLVKHPAVVLHELAHALS